MRVTVPLWPRPFLISEQLILIVQASSILVLLLLLFLLLRAKLVVNCERLTPTTTWFEVKMFPSVRGKVDASMVGQWERDE